MLVMGDSGDAPKRKFLSEVLGYSAPHDFRASLHDALNGVPSLMRKQMGLDMTSFVSKWIGELGRKEAQP